MTPPPRQLTQVLVGAFGSIIYSVCQWGILVVLARFGSVEDVGSFSYALAIAAPVSIFFTLSLRQVYVTDRHAHTNIDRYIKLRVLCAGLTAIVTVAVGLAVESLNVFLLAVALIKVLDMVADILLAPVQAAGRISDIGIYQASNGIISVALVIVSMMMGARGGNAIMFSSIGSLIALVYALRQGKRRYSQNKVHRVQSEEDSRKSKGVTQWKLAKIALPLGVAVSLGALTQSIPRYFLEQNAGLEELGYFTSMVYLVIAGNAFVAALAQFELPRTVETLDREGAPAVLKRLHKLSLFWITSGIVIVVFVWLYGSQIVDLIYGIGFGSRNVITILAISWVLGAVSWMIDVGLTAQRKFRLQLMTNFATMLTALLIANSLTQHHGQLGAAFVTLISSALLLVLRYLLLLSVSKPELRIEA